MTEKEQADRLRDFQCPITGAVFFDPVQAACGHRFERNALEKWLNTENSPKTCPCCRQKIEVVRPVDVAFELALRKISNNPLVSKEVYFDLDKFADIVIKNKLYATTGQRFIALLQNADNQLNDLATEGKYQGKSAIQVLASTTAGRALLRKKIRKEIIAGGQVQYFFGRAKISDESILERLRLEREEVSPQSQKNDENIFSRFAGFFSRSKNIRVNCDAVNPIIQDIVNGQREAARKKLDALKNSNPALLRTVLTATATQPVSDYSGRTFENMTLLEAAACVGDTAVNAGYQGMCEIILSYFESDISAKKITAKQLQTIFPNGVTAHVKEQAQIENIFDFFPIIVAIDKASPTAVSNALEKNGASLAEKNGAQLKSDWELTLDEALNRFREQFKQCALNEKIFNPQHLLKAMQLYDAQYNAWSQDQRDLFIRQVIGFVQRFLPPNDAQIFLCSLNNLVKSNNPVPDQINHFYSDTCNGLGFDYMIAGRARDTAPSLMTLASNFSELISIKNKKVEEMISGSHHLGRKTLRNI